MMIVRGQIMFNLHGPGKARLQPEAMLANFAEVCQATCANGFEIKLTDEIAVSKDAASD